MNDDAVIAVMQTIMVIVTKKVEGIAVRIQFHNPARSNAKYRQIFDISGWVYF